MADLNVQVSPEYDPQIPKILPHEKVYSIQVGFKLFRLSGLSLSSDAPSYFTRYFSEPENEDKVLFFDRSPEIFELIYNHLQGYSISIGNDYQFMHLWSDCFYFGLKNLQSILTEQEIFASVGGVSFKIPKVLFGHSEGNYPNYFTMNYDRMLMDNILIVEQQKMLRPPPQRPANVANRSPKLFSDLLELLRGNEEVITSDNHRKLLIRECRYYRFLELEQRILKHNIITYQGEPAIVINLLDLTRKGILNLSPPDKKTETPLLYTRPYIPREPSRSLIVQIDEPENSQIKLILNKSTGLPTVKITNKLCTKITQTFKDYLESAITTGLNSDTPAITFFAGFKDSKCTVNGQPVKDNWIEELLGVSEDNPTKKRKKSDDGEAKGDIIAFRLKRSMWKLMMRGSFSRLHAVSVEAFTDVSNSETIDFL